MKRPIVLSLLVAAVMLLAGAFSTPTHAQSPSLDDKPTFYRLTPGVYVNGWPRFTITYPKDWVVVEHPLPQEVFRAAASEAGWFPSFHVTPSPTPLPLDKVADLLMSYAKTYDKNATVVSDKPSQLRDGTPAREVEIQYFSRNGVQINWLTLGTKRGDLWINTGVVSNKGKVGEDLKAILYSLKFEPGKDEPVKVPPDIQEFLNRWRNDLVSHDVTKVMANYSDNFLDSGAKRADAQWGWKQLISSITSVEIGITDIEVAGDKAYLAGFISAYWGKAVLRGTAIIRETGQWKWYGNQR
jgi:hypothetical protein